MALKGGNTFSGSISENGIVSDSMRLTEKKKCGQLPLVVNCIKNRVRYSKKNYTDLKNAG